MSDATLRAAERMKVTEVFVNHRRQLMTIVAERGAERLCCDVDPRSMQDHIRQQLGPPPVTSSVAKMEERMARCLLGERQDDPKRDYREAAVAILAKIASRYMRGAEVPAGAAEALLDYRDWKAS